MTKHANFKNYTKTEQTNVFLLKQKNLTYIINECTKTRVQME